MTDKTYTLTITERNGTSRTFTATRERHARLVADDETKWESCLRVTCPELSIDLWGDYATPVERTKHELGVSFFSSIYDVSVP